VSGSVRFLASTGMVISGLTVALSLWRIAVNDKRLGAVTATFTIGAMAARGLGL